MGKKVRGDARSFIVEGYGGFCWGTTPANAKIWASPYSWVIYRQKMFEIWNSNLFILMHSEQLSFDTSQLFLSPFFGEGGEGYLWISYRFSTNATSALEASWVIKPTNPQRDIVTQESVDTQARREFTYTIRTARHDPTRRPSSAKSGGVNLLLLYWPDCLALRAVRSLCLWGASRTSRTRLQVTSSWWPAAFSVSTTASVYVTGTCVSLRSSSDAEIARHARRQSAKLHIFPNPIGLPPYSSESQDTTIRIGLRMQVAETRFQPHAAWWQSRDCAPGTKSAIYNCLVSSSSSSIIAVPATWNCPPGSGWPSPTQHCLLFRVSRNICRPRNVVVDTWGFDQRSPISTRSSYFNHLHDDHRWQENSADAEIARHAVLNNSHTYTEITD